MRVHLLGTPNGQTTRDYALDGFIQRTILFARLLKRLGHEVWLYASEENDAPCDKLIRCITKAQQAAFLGETPYQSFDFTPDTPIWRTFNTTATAHIQSYKQAGDVIATIAGMAQRIVADQHPELKTLEYSIGYQGIFAPYRIYQSHIWRHCAHGYTGMDGGREFDGVIPPWFPADEFPSRPPEGYVAFCGRVVERKGLATACAAARAANVPLKVIGFGKPELVTYGDYLGPLVNEARNDVLARASAVLMPTQYLEPFGNVSAEAQLCGTPVIATDYGAFVESVEHGVTGFRCHYLGEYVQAIQAAPGLDRQAIRARAQRLYSEDAAAESYRAYFHRLALVGRDGWESLAPTPDPAFLIAETEYA